uniref:Uncharacterized protein n=1 Tax=Phaeomonas parva TaxID=124430 RepID=A0A6U4LN45_9STRA|mmetsp:Transcript_9452/g.27790  ORF Transcript_9452/g.27790 Transcript_9452/m.27790 type:complete len:130 (+) Transcript_9452:791-1180(+)
MVNGINNKRKSVINLVSYSTHGKPEELLLYFQRLLENGEKRDRLLRIGAPHQDVVRAASCGVRRSRGAADEQMAEAATEARAEDAAETDDDYDLEAAARRLLLGENPVDEAAACAVDEDSARVVNEALE